MNQRCLVNKVISALLTFGQTQVVVICDKFDV